MAATTQPISIAPQARSQSQSQGWASKSPRGEGSQSWSIHPGPLFVSGSLGSIAGTSLSFGSKLYPGFSPAGQLLNPLDPSDFKCRVSSSIESDHSSLINTHMSEREIEQYRNFSCCGFPLPDMHELVEHFETHHVFLVDSSSSSSALGQPPNSSGAASGMSARSNDSSLAGALGPTGNTTRTNHVRQNSSLSLAMTGGGFDPDDMDLEMEVDSPPSSSSSHSSPGADGVALPSCVPYRYNPNGTISSVSSPPDTPLLSTPVSPVHGASFAASGQSSFPWASPASGEAALTTPTNTVPTGPSAFDSVHLPAKSMSMFSHPYAGGHNARKTPHHFSSMYALRGGAQNPQSHAALVASAMNGYSGYSDYSSGFPGTIASGSNIHMGMHPSMGTGDVGESAIHPGLLFGGVSNAGASNGTKAAAPPVASGSRMVMTSPRATPPQSREPSPSSNAIASGSAAVSRANSKGSAAPAAASTTLSRPAASLLLSKPFKCPKPGCMKSYKQANGLKYHVTHGQCNFTPPPELSSVEGLSEREAERRLRPFCCQVPPCQRRYKNMNGLRYHYQHSGDHGARGLALLASGNHDATKSQPSPPSISLDTDMPAGEGEQMYGGNTPTTLSEPSTPVPARGRTSFAFAMQSQPASAYASPFNSPRSGSPYGQQQTQGSQPVSVPVPQQAAVTYSQAQWAVQGGVMDAMMS
ncbi:hypothetical protein M0805_009621 [Coniferiporia weirii]|nr:hypothetical protein M0805_009621 [Coniferiporia weirii]